MQLFSIPVRRAIRENGNGWIEQVLNCVGLSTLHDEFEHYFEPNSFNRGYKNPNEYFNPELGIMKILFQIKSDKEIVYEFLNEIFKRLIGIEIEEAQFEKITYTLNFLGYELTVIEEDDYGNISYLLGYLSIGEVKRQEDMTLMRKEINAINSAVLTHYNEALETYSNGNFKSCIDNCRTAFEKFFSKFDSINEDYLKGILNVTNEKIIDDNGVELSSRNKIFKYWLDKKKGANRYRTFATIYSAMSGLGAHGEDNPTQADALLFLRMTEDVFLWFIQKK